MVVKVLLILLLVFYAIYFVLMLCFVWGWIQTEHFANESESTNASLISLKTKISVVIAARNESENIEQCVHSLCSQNYPLDLFEVIAVDDNSEDNTLEILESLQKKYSNLIVSQLEHSGNSSEQSFKKQAITIGIRLATGNLIVMTDADCVSHPDRLKTIAAFYEQTTCRMMVCPVKFEPKTGLLNTFQQLDLAGLTGITAGSLYCGFPVMANAGNLVFEKNVFEQVHGFEGNQHLPGGDDIMLLLKVKKEYGDVIRFLKNKAAIVSTFPAASFSEFAHQRLRWLSKSGHFGNRYITAILVAAYIFNLLLVVTFLSGIIFSQNTLLVVSGIIWILKFISEAFLIASVAQFFELRFSFSALVICNLLHVFYVLSFGILSKIISFQWKGRKYNH